MDLFRLRSRLGGKNESEKKSGGVQKNEVDEGSVQLPGQLEDDDFIDGDLVVAINNKEEEEEEEKKEEKEEKGNQRIELYEPPEETNKENCSDEVMPFVLDEDFDYDHVILTPKFTIREFKDLKK